MAYIPTKIISVVRNRLTESDDLNRTLSSFIGQELYLLLVEGSARTILSIGDILTFTPNLDFTKSITDAILPLLTDKFVAQFKVDHIPLKMTSGLYKNRLSVLGAPAYKDYQVHFTSVDTPTIIDDVKQKGFLDDLAITSKHDLSNCLVTVNGVFHQTRYFNETLYVLDGFRTIRLTGRNDIVIIDTVALGGHSVIPLTSDNVTKSEYQDAATVSLDTSITGKTVFAVIDGYFYHRDQDILSFVDSNHLKILTHKLPLIQQFRHNPRTLHQKDRYGDDVSQSSRKVIDAYESVFLNKKFIPTTTLTNADFQYSRLTAFHSFLIVINNPVLYTVSADIVPTGTPQFYEDLSDRNLSGMISYGCGLCPSYVISKDPSNRKSIFLPEQDYDVDWQNLTFQSPIIPSLIRDVSRGSKAVARFVDYVSA